MKSIRIAVYVSIVLGFARKLRAKFFATPKKHALSEQAVELRDTLAKYLMIPPSRLNLIKTGDASYTVEFKDTRYLVTPTSSKHGGKLECSAEGYIPPAGLQSFFSSSRVLYKEKEND